MLIDIETRFINFRNSRPAHESAIRAYHPVALAVIITVEEVGKIRMVLLVALHIWQEDQLLEEPGCMGAEPYRGGYIFNMLQQMICHFKRCKDLFRFISYLFKHCVLLV